MSENSVTTTETPNHVVEANEQLRHQQDLFWINIRSLFYKVLNILFSHIYSLVVDLINLAFSYPILLFAEWLLRDDIERYSKSVSMCFDYAKIALALFTIVIIIFHGYMSTISHMRSIIKRSKESKD